MVVSSIVLLVLRCKFELYSDLLYIPFLLFLVCVRMYTWDFAQSMKKHDLDQIQLACLQG